MEQPCEEEITPQQIKDAWDISKKLKVEISDYLFDKNFYNPEDWRSELWDAIIYEHHFIPPSILRNLRNKSLSKIEKGLIDQGKNPNYGWTYSHSHDVFRAFHWKNDLEIPFNKEKKERIRCIQASFVSRGFSKLPLEKLEYALENDLNNETKQCFIAEQRTDICQGIVWVPINEA